MAEFVVKARIVAELLANFRPERDKKRPERDFSAKRERPRGAGSSRSRASSANGSLSRGSNRSLGEIVGEALRLALATREKAANQQRKHPLPTFKGSGVQSGVELNNSAALLEVMER